MSDVTAAAKLTEGAGYASALINLGFMAGTVLRTLERKHCNVCGREH